MVHVELMLLLWLMYIGSQMRKCLPARQLLLLRVMLVPASRELQLVEAVYHAFELAIVDSDCVISTLNRILQFGWCAK